MKAIIFAATLALSPLTTGPSPDKNWHYLSDGNIEVMRVETTGVVSLRFCDGRMHRVGRITGRFVPYDARLISPVAFDRNVGIEARSLVNRIVYDMRTRQKKDYFWGMECMS